MAILFPDTAGQPTDGSFTHTDGGLTWIWNGTSWRSSGGTLDTFQLPTASTTVLGGVKVDGSTVNIDANGVITASGGGGGGGGGGTSLGSRQTFNASTSGSHSDGTSENITITAYKGYALYKVEVSQPAWVTLYVSSATRTSDASRVITQDPAPGSGVIAEVITHHYTQNIDLRDAKTVLSNSGTAIMGSAVSSGNNRAQEAIMKALDSPLLNDNKITGAKNVLLLIVSGNEEITIDEIGEINDHIQEQAGYGANIIMGVGDDSELEDSISVTIIATGFNSDQQDEISNTEAKKVVHKLEEDSNNLFNQIPDKEVKQVVNDNIDNSDKVIHVLEEENDNDADILITNNNIKSIEVIEPIEVKEEESFVSNNLNFELDNIEVKDDVYNEESSPTFDWSLFDNNSADLKNDDEKVETTIESDIDVNEFEVVDYIELVSSDESTEYGETVHELNDHIVLEPVFKENSDELEIDTIVEEKKEIELIQKDILVEDTIEAIESKIVDPINSPIADLQLQRSKERRLKMKEFNYKFNNSKIDDIEKEPAYKRLGVELEEVNHSSENNESRLTLDLDENDDIQLRTNNSFLHDNVD